MNCTRSNTLALYHNRRLLRFKYSCFLLLLTFGTLNAQQSSIFIYSKVDKSNITIGDLITYSVVVKRSPEIEVQMPELAANLGAFEIRDYEIYDPESKDGTVAERVDYIISTFDVGDFEIPPLIFYYTFPDDTTRHELKTEKIKIVVESLKPSEAGDIRDIKLPLGLPKNYKQLILWGGIALAILIALLIAFILWRKRKGKGLFPQKMEPTRPAHEIAFEELNALKNSSLLAEGKIKEYYIQLSEAIRRYIEGRYFIVALEQTTFELTNNLKNSIETENYELIQDFLENCDLVKFAKYIPTEKETDTRAEQAFDIVEKTKIVFEKFNTDEDSEAQSESVEEGNALEVVEKIEESS